MLAKAESTDFPDEAEALLAKAQELMARHAIDDAMLARAGRRASDTVDTRTILVEAPYATAKASLLGAVAQANGCRVVMGAAGDGAEYGCEHRRRIRRGRLSGRGLRSGARVA